MRHSFILLIFFATSCFGQEAKHHNLYNDTLNLIVPKPDIASIGDLKHCIILNQPTYIVVINGKKFLQSNEQKLTNFLKNNKKKIISHILSLIVDSNVSAKRMVDVLYILTILKIKKYKIVSLDSVFLSTPVIVQQPDIVSKSIDYNDSSFLTITLDNLVVTHLNKTDTLQNTQQLDKYITDNKFSIDASKILIAGSSKTSFERFNSVIEILKKHDYNKYKLIDKD